MRKCYNCLMKTLLALSFILVATGIPSVATYFPLQTYAVMSLFEQKGAQDIQPAAVIESAPASVPADPVHDLLPSDATVTPRLL